jgi:hypothetical protein
MGDSEERDTMVMTNRNRIVHSNFRFLFECVIDEY